MLSALVLHFKLNVTLFEDSSQIQLQSPTIVWKWKEISSSLRECIQLLNTIGATEDELCDIFQKNQDDLAVLYYYLGKFKEHFLLSFTVCSESERLVTLIPTSNDFIFESKKVFLDKKYLLSRFAYWHLEQANMILETPLSSAKIIIESYKVSKLLHALAKPQIFEDLLKSYLEISEESLNALILLFLNAKVITLDETSNEEQELALVQWEFHDLLFHSRSRKGRHENPFGGTYRFRDKIKPLAAIKTIASSEIIDLYRPDLEKLKKEDHSFTKVLENRKSIREEEGPKLTIQQLGEFLYRSARIKNFALDAKLQMTDLSHRPSPSGGAIYELELYPIISSCEGIEDGLYHYNPEKHFLSKLTDKSEMTETLLSDAYYSTGKNGKPQVLIVFAARFQRITWKYQSMAYATILKNVGALYQTMYLVATAMELSPCAIGGGNSDLFAKAAGTNYYAETTVGEFMLRAR